MNFGRWFASRVQKTKLQLVRRGDSVLDRIERFSVTPPEPSREIRLTCVFLQWDVERASGELADLLKRVRSFPGVALRYLTPAAVRATQALPCTTRWYGWGAALEPPVLGRKIQSILNEQLFSARAVTDAVALVPMQVAHGAASLGLDRPAVEVTCRILREPDCGGIAATRPLRLQLMRDLLTAGPSSRRGGVQRGTAG